MFRWHRFSWSRGIKTQLSISILGVLVSLTVLAKPVDIQILQINDVYEIGPSQGGKTGGLARVALLRKALLKRNPRTFTVLAGDFLSPSALGIAPVNQVPLAGRQMVSVLNTIGLDLAIFGNHEFDLKPEELSQRIQEAQFKWISGNLRDVEGNLFGGLPESYVHVFEGDGGEKVRVGFIALTIDTNKKDHVRYLDVVESAREQVKRLKPKVDVLVAMTHLPLEKDRVVAKQVPGIDLILGGHEHDHILVRENGVRIAKADANAKSAFIHILRFDPEKQKLKIKSLLKNIDDRIPEDRKTKKVVQKWTERAYQAFREAGFEPTRVVGKATRPLDGSEASVRSKTTAMTELVGRSMMNESHKARFALYNGSSIRIDDVIQPGPITEYDVIRMLPFGGALFSAQMTGKEILALLEENVGKRGKGTFLQIIPKSKVDLERLDPNEVYSVSVNDLFSKMHAESIVPGSLTLTSKDVRASLIKYLKERK
ncbi:MAG: bifunctional metallophosphatase/5'-nucleotidase [Bdellovibrionota bacterium]